MYIISFLIVKLIFKEEVKRKVLELKSTVCVKVNTKSTVSEKVTL